MEKGATSGLTRACEALSIEDDADGVVVEVEDIVQPEYDFRYAAVGRVVTDRPVKFVVFRDVIATAWRPTKGVHVREIGNDRFLFTFYMERDVSRVVDDGPWTFEQNLVVVRRLVPGDDPVTIGLNVSSFWIQVHGLQPGFMSEKVAVLIGNYVGEFEACDQRNFEGSGKTFMRIRVKLQLLNPLQTKMKLKKPGGDWFWVDLRYERLPSFCFHCGVIGHGDRFCPTSQEKFEVGKAKPFGSWLRAGGKRVTTVSANRWLVLNPEVVSPVEPGGGFRWRV